MFTFQEACSAAVTGDPDGPSPPGYQWDRRAARSQPPLVCHPVSYTHL